MSALTTRSTTQATITKSSKKSAPKDSNYQQKLIDGGVFPYCYKYPDGRRAPLPSDWEELKQSLAQPRPSLSPSAFPEEEYQEFVQADAEAFNEDAVKDSVPPAMLKAMGTSTGAQRISCLVTSPLQRTAFRRPNRTTTTAHGLSRSINKSATI